MPRAKKVTVERTEFDWHTPLYDQKEFREYATNVVLKAITKTMTARRRIKEKLGKRVVPLWVDHALAFLVLYGHAHAEVRGQGITYYTTVIPVVEKKPEKEWNGYRNPLEANGRVIPLRKQRPPGSNPHWQQFG